MSGIDEAKFYYQNPKTGTVSTTVLSARQLCKLLVPAREGMPPILTPRTMVVDTSEPRDEQEWKPASAVPVLREASSSWYRLDRRTAANRAAQPSDAAVSCRALLDEYSAHRKNRGDDDRDLDSSFLVFAQGITDDWTPVSDLDNLRVVFRALEQPTMEQTALESEAPAATRTSASWAGRDSSNAPSSDDGVQDELERFLAMADGDTDNYGTAIDRNSRATNGTGAPAKNYRSRMDPAENDQDDSASFQSDGGTRYVQDPVSGNWIHEAVAALHRAEAESAADTGRKKTEAGGATHNSGTAEPTDGGKKKRKHKKAQFAKKNAKCWIYVSGLPTTELTEDDVAKFFGRTGLIDLDPETMKPKIKLYRDKRTGHLKGDASICYAKAESVDLALQVLDQSPWDASHTLTVQRAHFEAKKDDGDDGAAQTHDRNSTRRRKRPVSEAQRKVARLALLQAQDEGFGERLAGGRKGLRIVVVENMADGLDEAKWEPAIHERCERDCGPVEKITVLSKNNNIVIVKFVEPTAASKAVESWNNAMNLAGKRPMTCKYWDGVTDYTNSHENQESRAEEDKRHEDFGNWLEDQELPPELQLQVEGGSS